MIIIAHNEALRQKHIDYIVPRLNDYLNKLPHDDNCIEYIRTNLKRIVGATADQLQSVINDFNVHCSGKDTKCLDEFTKIYSNWSRWKDYNPYVFVEELELKTCPYCNRNYIFSVNKRNGRLRPEMDHFYPKSDNPIVAISFGNLIPSCSVCNHTKSDKNHIDLVNPYDTVANDYHLTIMPNSIDFALVEAKKYNFSSFDIEVRGNAIENIKMFKLKELYSQHKDEVLELLIKKAYYPKSYIKELESFGFSQDEIYRYLFSNYSQDEDLHKRPLSKLIKDISTELGLI